MLLAHGRWPGAGCQGAGALGASEVTLVLPDAVLKPQHILVPRCGEPVDGLERVASLRLPSGPLPGRIRPLLRLNTTRE